MKEETTQVEANEVAAPTVESLSQELEALHADYNELVNKANLQINELKSAIIKLSLKL